MKPLFSTSVFGLVPLPQLSERDWDESRGRTDASGESRELGSGDLCPCAEDQLANAKNYTDRLALYARLIFGIFRRRGEDR